ncbi:biotin--[acetyl-CoA-carboxylase] ligase [Nitriliruptoraceae bacterium ZYF776]|nr:biotin--[acetyl-CoA-carboxylase] ligase [Profundirhabdus halotolerans]
MARVARGQSLASGPSSTPSRAVPTAATSRPRERTVTVHLDDHERVRAVLGGPLGWHTLRHVGEVGSTNDDALAAAREGAPPGLVVVADHQRAGRGRQGRPWQDASGPGEVRSLLVSTLVAVPEAHASLVPLAVGLAVADAVRRAGLAPALKWPNDLMVEVDDHRAKCAGILVERHATPDGPHREVLVVGVGIDLDWRDLDRVGEARRWTSLAEVTGRDVDRGDVLADLLRALAVRLRSVPTDPVRLLVAYRDACATIGQDVRVSFPDGEVLEGRAVDLDREGRLVVDAAGAGPVAVTAGDVEHVRPAG